MNTRRGIITIVSGVLLCTLLQNVQANSNHLEPISPYDSFDIDDTLHTYRQAVFTSLIGKGWWPSLWMIEEPSFSREYAVVVWQTVDYDPNDNRPPHWREIKRKQWVVEYVAPKEKIWKWKHVGDGRESLDIKPTKDVERHRIPITDDLAKAVQEAWLSTLQLTRYGENRWMGLDGTTLEFCSGGLFGQTWSPDTGLPAMLADLGRKLSAIALSEEKNREPLLAEADRLARRIAKEAEAEQIKLFGRKLSTSRGRFPSTEMDM